MGVLRHGRQRVWTSTIVIRQVRVDRSAGIENDRSSLSHACRPPLSIPDEQHETDHEAHEHRRTHSSDPQPADEAPSPFPGKEDAPVGGTSSRSHQSTSWFIWIRGIRIAMAMNPTTPPSKTIITGSSKLVSATTLVSTSAS